MPGHDPAPYREPEGNERWILLGSFVFGLVALVAIVVDDYEPVKLAPVFMLLAWFPLIALHELGHAVVARLLGWEVEELVVGFGGVAFRFEVFGVPCTVATYPLGGWVRPVPRDLRGVRAKSALVYAAGPLAELALVAVLVLVLGWDTMTTRTDVVPIIAAQAVSVAALLGAASNLVPRRIDTEHGAGFTDGMGVLVSLWRPRGSYEAQVREGHERRIEDRALLGDVGGTVAACEEAFAAVGDHPHLRSTMRSALDRLAERDHDAVARAVRGRRLPRSLEERFAA